MLFPSKKPSIECVDMVMLETLLGNVWSTKIVKKLKLNTDLEAK